MKILVVDDDQKIRRKISEDLREAKHETREADGVGQAKEIMEKETFHHVVSDGLEDDWRKVYELTREKRIPMTIFSGRLSIRTRIKEEKLEVNFILKEDYGDGSILLEAISPRGGSTKKKELAEVSC